MRLEVFPPALPLTPAPADDAWLQWLIIVAAVAFIGWFVVAGFIEAGRDK